MKKYLVLFFAFVPVVSFGAPSVKTLGSKTPVASVVPGGQVTPAKVGGGAASKSSAVSRIGTLKQGAKTSSVATKTVSGGSGNSSRFPVVSTAHTYSAVTAPSTTAGTAVYTGVDTGKIISDVEGMIDTKISDYDTENVSVTYATKEELEGAKAEIQTSLVPLATKTELEPLATKEELEPLATKKEVEDTYAKKSDLEGLTTPAEVDLSGYVKTTDLEPLATKAELNDYAKTNTIYVKDSQEFKDAVKAIAEDDPRFDAVIYVADDAENFDPATKWTAKGKQIPEGYVYMWVEK